MLLICLSSYVFLALCLVGSFVVVPLLVGGCVVSVVLLLSLRLGYGGLFCSVFLINSRGLSIFSNKKKSVYSNGIQCGKQMTSLKTYQYF